ncbi:MAG: phosphocholine cytidylyltransferase family protein [Candidatus Margulisbacteria bacterium]|nr:phosphocholine cytidylyltransferase family protein [Candidatus Margulisiibacteriota bacterium]MBU1021075.1 phosphocholine cytidylyltransferase family protein [Candidatus Margulisiibacteriota bacterium]MBU1729884.1 phosphocholine cytidylyltransferase family protein [Candidatus Margulisiibacteriota bacterium]MBU1955214.1 phosphocholine cytidylyltransferase family protein [Candidatus Margulisiibacteriota bacterium]
MKVIILAAGMGTRLFPITKKTHKCLLEVGGKLIIQHQLDAIKSYGDIEVVVVGGYKIDDLKNHLKDSVTVLDNPRYETTNSIVSLWIAKKELDDDVIIMNADIIFDEMVFRRLAENEDGICVAISKKWDPKKGYKVQIKGKNIVDMGMNLAPNIIGGEYAGIIKFSKSAAKLLQNILDSFMKENKVTGWFESAVVKMLKNGSKANFITVDDYLWHEIDTKDELENTRKIFNKGKMHV